MASATRRPYATLLSDFVTGPLDMKDTTATPNSNQCQRLMRTSQTGICSNTSATQASGGLYSTANDIARWMQAMLSPRRNASERLAMRMLVRRDRLSTTDGLDIAGHVDAIGMAWLQQDATGQHPRIIQKTGGGNGFMSYIALAPDRNEGIFVCFDRVDMEALRKVTQLANSFLAKGSQ